MRGLYNKDYSILGSILGSPYFRKAESDNLNLRALCVVHPHSGL